jgi:hypothetical protein
LIDGSNNLYINDKIGYGDAKTVWSTGTAGKGTPNKGQLIMQDDGQLVLIADGVKLWSSSQQNSDVKSEHRGNMTTIGSAFIQRLQNPRNKLKPGKVIKN